MANKSILSLKKLLQFCLPRAIVTCWPTIFSKTLDFFNKELGNHKQMSGSEGFISVVMQIV